MAVPAAMRFRVTIYEKNIDIFVYLGYCMSIYNRLGYSVSVHVGFAVMRQLAIPAEYQRHSRIEVSPHLNITPLMGRTGTGPAHSFFYEHKPRGGKIAV